MKFAIACGKGLLISQCPGATLEKFAAIVNPENKPTKVSWSLKGLIGIGSVGKAWILNLATAFGKGLLQCRIAASAQTYA